MFVLAIMIAAHILPFHILRAGGLSGTQWPKWGQNERNTSRQSNFFVQTGGFTLHWTLDLGGYDPGVNLQAGIILDSNGTLYGGGYTNSAPFYAIDQSGSLLWRVALGDGSQPGHAGSPALHSDGNIIVANPYGTHKLNPSNGSVLWKFSQFRTYTSSPAIGSDGTIFSYGVNLSNGAAMFFALNPGDGSLKWSKQLTGSFDGAPALASDGTIYITTSNGQLWAINPSDGSTVWTYALGEQPTASPIVGVDGTIYVGGLASVFAVNANGTLKWSYDTGSDYFGVGMAEAEDGTVFASGIGSQSYIFALNPNGTLKWQRQMDSPVDGGLSVDGQGNIYAPANVTVYALRGSDGNVLWQYDKPSGVDFSFFSTPIISPDSRLLLITGADNGVVTALIPKGLQSQLHISKLSKPPTITIESPKTGEAVGGSFTLVYKAEDPDGNGSEFGLGDKPIWIDYSLNQGIPGTWQSYLAGVPNEGKVEFDKDRFGDGAAVYFRAVARDRTGLFSETTVGPVGVDATAPAFLVKAESPEKPGFITLTITSTEALAGAPDVHVDQGGRGKVLAVTRGEGRRYVAEYEVVQHFDGIATVYVTGKDLAGNTGDKILSGDRFSIFVTPPSSPSVTSPANGDVIADAVVDVEGTAVAGAEVILTVNGIDRYVTTPDADGAFRFERIALSQSNRGENTLSLVAEDRVGVSEPVIITLSVNALPQVLVTSPRNVRILSDAVRVAWSAQDANADTLHYAVAYAREGGPWITLAENLTQSEYVWDTTLVPDGPGTRIRITASDGRGSSFTTAGPFSLQNNLPTIALSSPVDEHEGASEATAIFVNAVQLDIRGSARSGKYTVRNLEYRRVGQAAWITIPASDGSYDGAAESFALMLPLQQGLVSLQFKATDDRGKAGFRAVAFTFDATPPAAPRVLLESTPAVFADTDDRDSQLPGLQVPLRGTAEGDSTIHILSGGEERFVGQASSRGAFEGVLTLSGHGETGFAAYAEDAAGNRSQAAAFTLIANNPPSLAFTFPRSDEVVGARHVISWRADDSDRDPVGGFSLAWRRRGQRNWTNIARDLSGSEFTWNGAQEMQNGLYDLQLTGSDGYGRREIMVPIRIDTVAPTITLQTVIPDRLRDPIIRVDGTARDDVSGVEAVEYAFIGDQFTKATLVSGWRTRNAAWRITLPAKLADGDYTLAIRAVDRGENGSAPVSTVFTIDTTPPRIGAWRVSLGPLQLMPADDGVVEVFAQPLYDFAIAVADDARDVSLAVGDQSVTLTQMPGGLFGGTMRITEGTHPMEVSIADDLGNTKSARVGSLRAISPARVIRAQDAKPVADAEVSAYVFDADEKTWRLFDAASYGLVNPQKTDEAGMFHYLLPRGTYEIRVRADGYMRVKTAPFTLERPTLITLALPLTKATFFERVLDILP
ncbi:MAG: PQQ-binding-like beta-propeller repeat protein [bacterium]|nr:PQQ-binding-like beta-propeller repeat protein [bacterium]